MSRLLGVLTAAVVLLAAVPLGIAGEPDCTAQIRILSYNIHHGAGVDGKLDLERIAKVISSVSPGIVSLQEVDRKTERTGGVDQAEELGRLTGMKVLFGASMPYQGGEYGNAVLTKFKVLDSKVRPLAGGTAKRAVHASRSPVREGAGTDLFLHRHSSRHVPGAEAGLPAAD